MYLQVSFDKQSVLDCLMKLQKANFFQVSQAFQFA